MKKEKYRVNILGTPYKIYFRNDYEDVFLRKADGYMDKSSKIIVIAEKPYDSELENFPAYQKKVMRHEIIHAFFEESGLSGNNENLPNGVPEMYVDWFAIQSPKIYEVFKQLDIL